MASPAPEAQAAHRALVSSWGSMYDVIPGARFEERHDLILLACPEFPIPQCNGAWVSADSEDAAAALPGILAEVAAAGGPAPSVQTRSGHDRTQAAARSLGLTHVDRVPLMVARPDELVDVAADLEIGRIENSEIEECAELLAVAFGAPTELFSRFAAAFLALPEVIWYVGRLGGDIASTAVSFAAGGAIGIFNVATPPAHRRRGYGAALTARAARDGFAAGSEFAYLQSSELGHGVYRQLGFRDVGEYVVLTSP